MPWNQTFSEDNKLVPCESATILQASKGKIIIVLGARSNNCPKVCRIGVICRYSYLKGAIQSTSLQFFFRSDFNTQKGSSHSEI